MQFKSAHKNYQGVCLIFVSLIWIVMLQAASYLTRHAIMDYLVEERGCLFPCERRNLVTKMFLRDAGCVFLAPLLALNIWENENAPVSMETISCFRSSNNNCGNNQFAEEKEESFLSTCIKLLKIPQSESCNCSLYMIQPRYWGHLVNI